MKRAIVTFAVGEEHQKMLEITRPRMEKFCRGQDFIDASNDLDVLSSERPPSWRKVPLLRRFLEYYDVIVWLDCDVYIAKLDAELYIPEHSWQALVQHNVLSGRIPNCGVWIVRKPMIPVLENMWQSQLFVNHPWWEQAAMIKWLGGDPVISENPIAPWPAENELEQRTHWLGYEWNAVPHDVRRTGTGHNFYHATGCKDRLALLKLWEKMYG